MTIPVARLIPLLMSFIALGVAVVMGGLSAPAAGVLLLVGAVLGVVGEVIVHRTALLERALEAAQGDLLVRGGLRDLLVLTTLVTANATARQHIAPVAMTVAILVAGRAVLSGMRGQTQSLRAYRITWRNLAVQGVVRRPPFAPVITSHLELAASLGAFALMGGAGLTLMDWGAHSLRTAIAIASTVLVVTLSLAALDLWRASRDTSHRMVVQRVADTLHAFAPEVVFYYSRPEPIGYIANVWMRTLEQLPQGTFVLARQSFNADRVRTDVLPVVAVELAGDIERIVPPSVALALYPSNVAENNHLIRLPGIFDAFIGHGDSDKGGSATTLTRIYDEAWVSGPAARDRYRIAGVGVREEQLREVGRPQLGEIQRTSGHDEPAASHGWDYTVLYAPTREGFFSGWQYSSVVTQGEHILTTLMGMPGVRVLFKPHPGTGTDDPHYGAQVEFLKSLVTKAGAPHEVISGAEGLYHAFNRADLLVSDISSVITDFLASGKPYVVTSASGLDVATFRAEFPSAGGAYILDCDGGELTRFIADARGPDSMQEARKNTASYLLGDTSVDPVQPFKEAVTEAIRIQRGLAARVR